MPRGPTHRHQVGREWNNMNCVQTQQLVCLFICCKIRQEFNISAGEYLYVGWVFHVQGWVWRKCPNLCSVLWPLQDSCCFAWNPGKKSFLESIPRVWMGLKTIVQFCRSAWTCVQCFDFCGICVSLPQTQEKIFSGEYHTCEDGSEDNCPILQECLLTAEMALTPDGENRNHTWNKTINC